GPIVLPSVPGTERNFLCVPRKSVRANDSAQRTGFLHPFWDSRGTEGGSTDKLFHSFCRGSRRLPVSNSTLRSIRMACWLSVVLLERHHIPPALNDFATPVNLFLKNTAADQLAAVFLSFKEIA